MAFLTKERGIWVSAAAKEASFGTAAALDSRVRIEVANFITPEYQTVDDQDLLGATQEASSQILVARAFAFPFNIPRVPPHALAFVARYGLGQGDTATPTGASAARRHRFSPSKGSTELDTFTVGERFTSSVYRRYQGGGVGDFALNVQRQANRMVGLTSNLLLSSLVTSATEPTTKEVTENPINGNNSRIFLGEQVSGFKGYLPDVLALTANDMGLAADTEITNQVNSLTWNFNNNIAQDSLFTLKSGLGFGQMQRGAPTQTLEMSFNFENDDLLGFIDAQTILSFQIKIRGGTIEAGHYYGMSLVVPRAIIQTLPPANNNDFIAETPTLRILESPDRVEVTDGTNGATNAAGTTLTSTGATFTTGADRVLAGDMVAIGNASAAVDSVTPTTVTVDSTLGSSLSGQTFVITREPLPSVILDVWNRQTAYAA